MALRSRPRALRLLASLLLAGVLFAYFLHRAPLREVLATVAGVDAGNLLVAVAAALLSYALRAIRWGLLLRPAGRAPAGRLLGATAAGFATSTIFPARAGELVRPLLLASQTRLPAAATLASILTERLVDLASVLALFAVGVGLARHTLLAAALPALARAAAVAAAALVAGVALLALLLRRPERVTNTLVSRVPQRFRERAERFLQHLLDGLRAVQDPRTVGVVVLASACVWLPVCFQIQLTGRAFGQTLPLATTFVVLGVSVLGLAVPTPAGVGGFHAAVQFALTALVGVDLKTATAFALVHHAVCFFPITAVGLAYLAAAGAALADVSRGPGAGVAGGM